MVEVCVFKIAGVCMAGRASSPPMVSRRAVAGTAVSAANRGVIEAGVFKVACVLVAGIARASEVVSRGAVAA